MAKNLRKGSLVWIPQGKLKPIPGKVTKKYTARKGSVNVPLSKRTVVHVRGAGNLYVKAPSELKRRK